VEGIFLKVWTKVLAGTLWRWFYLAAGRRI